MTILSKSLMGRISHRYGRRPLINGGMVLCALSFGVIPLLHNFYLFLITATFFGLGEALVTSSSAALVADTFSTIFDVGHAAGPIIDGLLLADRLPPGILDHGAVLLASIPVFLLTVTHEGRVEPAEVPKIV